MGLCTAVFSLLLFCASVNAQNTFWSEDFTGGVGGWSTDDTSGNGVLWTWCSNGDYPVGDCDGTVAPPSGCHRVWCDGLNLQGNFASSTNGTGFMTCDSDAAGNITHQSRLTSPSIPTTGENTVVLRVESQIGIFTIDAEVGAFLQVSNDGGTNWDDYILFPGLIAGAPDPPNVRWSFNPQIIEVDISATAANQAGILLRFVWDGNYEYHWSLDDVSLQDMVTPPPVAETQLGFGLHAPSWATPINQIASVELGGFVSNNGVGDMTNVTLNATITNSGGTEVFNEDGVLAQLDAGFADSLVVLGTTYVPPAVTDQYTINYNLTQDLADENPADNIGSSSFAITEQLFSKDNGVIISGSANAAGGTYEFGNFYEIINPDSVSSITFGIGKNAADGPIDGESGSVYLFRVNCDLNTPECVDGFDDSQVTAIGVGFWTIPDEDPDIEDYTPQTVDLLDFNTFQPGPIAVDPGTYIAMVSIVGNGVDNTIFVGTADPGYAPGQLASVVREGGPIGGGMDTWFLAGFGPETIAFCRMNVTSGMSATNVLTPEELAAKVEVYPNPTSRVLNLDVVLEEQAEAMITILDAKGSILRTEVRENLSSELISFDLSEFANGIYYISISTENGVKTERFTVAR